MSEQAQAKARAMKPARRQGMLLLVAETPEGVQYDAAHLLGSKVVGHRVLERRARLFAQAERMRELLGRMAALLAVAPPAEPDVFEALGEAREILAETE